MNPDRLKSRRGQVCPGCPRGRSHPEEEGLCPGLSHSPHDHLRDELSLGNHGGHGQ